MAQAGVRLPVARAGGRLPAVRAEVRLPAVQGMAQRMPAPVDRLVEDVTLPPLGTLPLMGTRPRVPPTAALSPDVRVEGSRRCTTPGAEWMFITG